MSNAKNKILAEELGFKFQDDIAYGVYKNYPASIYDLKDCKVLFIDAAVKNTQQLQKDEIHRYIVECSKQYSIRSSSISESGIKIAFNRKVGVFDNIADFFLSFVLFLESNGIEGDKVCTNCGRKITGPYKLVCISGEIHSCDEKCTNKLLALGSTNKKTAASKAVVLGTLGALAGSILGGIGYVAFSTTGLFYLWFAAMIALFCKIGYYIFGGESVKGDIISTLLFSVLSVFTSQMIIEGINVSAIWKSRGYIFGIAEPFIAAAKSILRNMDALLPYLKSCGIACVFAILALIVFTGIIKAEKPELPEVEIVPEI